MLLVEIVIEFLQSNVFIMIEFISEFTQGFVVVTSCCFSWFAAA